MKRNRNVGYRGMERKEGLEFHGAPPPHLPRGGRHPEDVAGCKNCGMELEPKEEKIGLCKDCAGQEHAIQSKIDARLGKGIRDYIDLRKAGMHCPPEGYDVEHEVKHKLKKKKVKKAGMGIPSIPSTASAASIGKPRRIRKPKTVQTITTRISQGLTKSIKRVPVESTNLESIGYDPKSQKLHVGFRHKGAVYEYDDVSPDEHHALMTAPSIGKHFNEHIRMAKEYRRLKSLGDTMGILDYIEKARSKPWRSKRGKAKIERTFHEYGEGRLHSGSKHGPTVTSHKQAIAIALNQARRAGRKKSLFEGDGIIDYIIKAKSMKLGGGGRFAKLKGKLAHREGVTDPGALAGYIGRKKYGNKKMGKMSAKGRKRAKG